MTLALSVRRQQAGSPKRPALLIAILAGLSALGQFASNIYIASIPSIAGDLMVGTGQVQITLAVFLGMFAIGQLFAGPLADGIGRRPTALLGLALFTTATLWGMIATDIVSLISARALQGIGAAATIVVSRAIVRDLFQGAELAKTLALITVVFALVPGLTPLLGGSIETVVGWRWTFAATALFALFVLWGALRLNETLEPNGTESEKSELTLRVYRRLLTDKAFLQPAIASSLVMGAMAAFFAGSPVVFIERLDVTPFEYGLYPPLAVTGFIIGTVAVRHFANKQSPDRLMQLGVLTMLVFALLMIAVPAFGFVHKHAFNGAMIGFVTGLGIFLPIATASALSPFGDVAGRCAALLGFLQMTGGAVGTLLVPPALSSMPIVGFAAVMTLMSGLAFIVFSGLLGGPELLKAKK